MFTLAADTVYIYSIATIGEDSTILRESPTKTTHAASYRHCNFQARPVHLWKTVFHKWTVSS